MWSVTLLALAVGLASAAELHDWPPHYDKSYASPKMACDDHSNDVWKAPQEYLERRRHDVQHRDHGCVTFPEHVHETYHCENFYIKNKFSEQNVKPSQILLEFQYHKDVHHQRKFVPAVTWVEHVTPWKVHACAAIPGGKSFDALNHGKLRWLAIYDIQQTNREQSGVLQHSNLNAFTTGHRCFHVDFPQQFFSRPHVKLTQHAKCHDDGGFNPAMIWIKHLTTTGFELCFAEWNQFSAYHQDNEIYWYAVTEIPNEDAGRQVGSVTFAANEAFPTNAHDLNRFYCKNVTLQRWHYPCPAIMLQVVEQSDQVCETEMVAWAPIVHEDHMTVCYNDRRGLAGRRKVDVEVQFIIYGHQDGCQNQNCERYRECTHPTWNTVSCGCIQHCPHTKELVCGSDRKTYENKCVLEKIACETKSGVYYSHPGRCEPLVRDSDRVALTKEAGCDGLYCARVDMKHKTFYEHCQLHVQASVNWGNNNMGDKTAHDASALWVEDVSGKGFKVCVREAGRRDLANPPHVSWFAYQGMLENVTQDVIDVGAWRTGTHCVPLHQRKQLVKPEPWAPPQCKDYINNMGGMTDNYEGGMDMMTGMNTDGKGAAAMSMMRQNRGMLYDHHLMAAIYGNHHHEWFKRMQMGYGAERMKITDGMKMEGNTVMLTVEHGDKNHDGINAWMEVDKQTKEAYVCLREQTNFAGNHHHIKVHWMMVHGEQVSFLGHHHTVNFKPHYFAPMYSNYAFCQTQQYKPDGMDLVNSATLLVSLKHSIPRHASLDSMKKHMMHGMEVEKGMEAGDAQFDEPQVVESWMMPHMWRANLSGWMPTDRISKDTDYSVWVEGYNGSHVKVCQKSIYSGFHFEGVSVSLITIPDRCQAGYTQVKNHQWEFCAKYHDDCTSKQDASQKCRNENAYLGTPRDNRETYLLSNMAGGEDIQIGLNDQQQDGQWVRDNGHNTQNHLPLMGNSTSFVHWHTGEPDGGIAEQCVDLSHRNRDYTYRDYGCQNCRKFTCMKEAPFLSCDHYCLNCGRCSRNGVHSYSCECVPPYTGTRCETNMETGHVGEEQMKMAKAAEQEVVGDYDGDHHNYHGHHSGHEDHNDHHQGGNSMGGHSM